MCNLLRHTQNGVGSYSVLPRPLKSSSCYLEYFSSDLVQSFFPLSCSQLSLTSVYLAQVQSLPFLSLSLPSFFFPLNFFSSFSFHPTFPLYFPILCLPLFPPSFFPFFLPLSPVFLSLFPLSFPLSFIFLLPSVFTLLFFLPFFLFRSSIFSFSPFLPSIFHFVGEE